ncbi:MAG TPA: DUF2156 domain-containing protein [Deltaproteobacteria bacterium]|nr:DUF2156 domain-containing protein [Deltaproteobacteria bacterium]
MSIASRAETQPRRSDDRTGAKILSMNLYRAGVKGGIDLFSLEERLVYLRNYGNHCMSFSGLQPGMQYFDIPGMGYIAFKQLWGLHAVLADPVCHRKDRETLIREFLLTGRKIEFAQVSEEVADLLHEKFGYYCTQFGVESVVDLENWDLRGKKKQVLRTSVNHARNEGIRIEEKDSGEGTRQLTGEWLKTRKVRNREIVFLIRPMEMEYEEGTRRFYAYLDGELVGFIFFDPVYEDGRIISYAPNISRFSHRFRQGIFYPLMVHAMETFKEEGVKYLHLGLCPLVVGDDEKACESPILKRIIRLLYRYGNSIYSFKGLYFTKSRFCGSERKTFCAHGSSLPAKSFLTLFRLANII